MSAIRELAIIGANGIGENDPAQEFAEIIRYHLSRIERRDYLELGYFEQEVEGGNRRTPLEAVWNTFPALNQAEVRAALARCEAASSISGQIQVLSGGSRLRSATPPHEPRK